MRRIRNVYLIDTWSWIEYFLGNKITLPYIEGDEPLFTSIITLTELSRYCIWNYDEKTLDTILMYIRTRSTILPLDEVIALQAGTYIKKEVNGIADALILATARLNNLKIITGDHHFSKIPGTIVLE